MSVLKPSLLAKTWHSLNSLHVPEHIMQPQFQLHVFLQASW
jgi:hypothetical protein